MSNNRISNNRKNIIFSVYIVILLVVVPLLVWLSNSYRKNEVTEQTPPATPSSNLFKSKEISLGEQILVKENTNPDKQIAIDAFAKRDYPTAIARFISSLKSDRNDPESLIYLNNATALTRGNAVQVGVSVPIGEHINVAKEILRGVAQAQNEINQKGGIGGKLLEVAIANDNNDPELAKQIAIDFVNDRNTLAVIGHNSSEASIAAAPIYQQGGLVMISPTSTARHLSGIGSYIFRTTPSTRATADTLANYAVNTARQTRIAVCSDSQSIASQSFQEEFGWGIFNYGGKIVNINCDFSDSNFNPSEISSQAIEQETDALLIAPSLYDFKQAIGTIQANKKQLPLLGSQTMYSFNTLNEGRADANGMVISVVWHPKSIPGNSFHTDTIELWGGFANWRTAMAYDSTQAIIAGLKSSSDREQLQKSLSNPGFFSDGATGRIEFLPSGDRNLKGSLIRVQPGNKSGTGFDFVPIEVLGDRKLASPTTKGDRGGEQLDSDNQGDASIPTTKRPNQTR